MARCEGGAEQLNVGESIIVLVQGDITREEVDAIVNAANSSLMPGGGVCGAIHSAGGPEIEEACTAIRQSRGPLEPGEAVATPAGRLLARMVIHAVGPRWRGGHSGESRVLAAAYRSSLKAARENGLRRVAFPSISTGIFGYPVREAAKTALAAVKAELEAYPGSYDEVRFVLWDDETMAAYREALRALQGNS